MLNLEVDAISPPPCKPRNTLPQVLVLDLDHTLLLPQVLVLDLDHTLLNSVRLSDVTSEDVAKLESILGQESSLGAKRLLYCLR